MNCREYFNLINQEFYIVDSFFLTVHNYYKSGVIRPSPEYFTYTPAPAEYVGVTIGADMFQ